MLKKEITIAMAAALIVGCGGGSSTKSPTVGTAYYIDSAVSGVDYTCGTQKGRTDEKGTFFFDQGKGCTFFLDQIPLRSVLASQLHDNAQIKEEDIKVARLLQSLDTDGNPTNGIQIKRSVIKSLENEGFTSFPKSESDFQALGNKLAQLHNTDANFKGTLVSEEEAQAHLEGNHLPHLVATASPLTIYKGETVHFDASSSSDPDRGDTLHYRWTMNGQTLSENAAFDHTFDQDPGTYKVTLTLSDTQNGSISKTFTITIDEGSRDHTPPTVTLEGDNPLVTTQNENVTDPGITATDDIDQPSDLTITKSGHINPDNSVMTDRIGRFQIHYSVKDQAGNETNATRELEVYYPNDHRFLKVLGDVDHQGIIQDTRHGLIWTNGKGGCLKLSASSDEDAINAAQNFCSNLNTIKYHHLTGWHVGTPEENRDFMVDAFGEHITPYYSHPSCVRMMSIDADGKITIVKTHNTHDIGGYEAHTYSDTVNQVAGVRCVTDQTVQLQPPVADAGADITVEENATFTFDGSGSRDPDGNIVKYEWIFRGSVIHSDSSPTYTREATQPTGDYNVTLRVTDDDNLTDEDYVIVHVTAP